MEADRAGTRDAEVEADDVGRRGASVFFSPALSLGRAGARTEADWGRERALGMEELDEAGALVAGAAGLAPEAVLEVALVAAAAVVVVVDFIEDVGVDLVGVGSVRVVRGRLEAAEGLDAAADAGRAGDGVVFVRARIAAAVDAGGAADSCCKDGGFSVLCRYLNCFATAMSYGVFPLLSRMLMSAPRRHRSPQSSELLHHAARWRGVAPSKSRALTFAPNSRSVAAATPLPVSAAA